VALANPAGPSRRAIHSGWVRRVLRIRATVCAWQGLRIPTALRTWRVPADSTSASWNSGAHEHRRGARRSPEAASEATTEFRIHECSCVKIF
jgi:hypothetical protein